VETVDHFDVIEIDIVFSQCELSLSGGLLEPLAGLASLIAIPAIGLLARYCIAIRSACYDPAPNDV
jgi:hydrogenase/urease accessory protein HupE